MHLVDKAFYLTETDASPKHVAGLFLFSLGNNQCQSDVEKLTIQLRELASAEAPFNCIIANTAGVFLRLLPVDNLDMTYHVQSHQIKDVGNHSLLDQFVADLHQSRLCRKKPMWQCHIINSEVEKKFAIYFKVHHAYGDGVTLLTRVMSGFCDTPHQPLTPAWAMAKKHHRQARKEPLSVWSKISNFVQTSRDMTLIFLNLLCGASGLCKNTMPLPFSAKRTPLNGQVSAGRKFATLDIGMHRITNLAKQTNATVNEIMVTCIDMGVHRFLNDYGMRLAKPITCMMPVNLRKPNDDSIGNKIAIALLKLSRPSEDPITRLKQNIKSNLMVKHSLRNSQPMAFIHYTILYQSFGILCEKLRLFKWIRPLGNVLISNLPGPKEQLYLGDFSLDAMYPVSILPPGGGVNITMVSYQHNMHIGMICCDAKISCLQPLTKYCLEALIQLETQKNKFDLPNAKKISKY